MKVKYLKLTTLMLVFTLLFSKFLVPVSAAAIDLELGTASTFGLLANTMTTVGTSVYGDTGAITQTGIPFITNGSNHVNDSAYSTANNDLGDAITYANAQTPTIIGAAGADLGGLTLLPGVYNYPGAVNIGADVTLSGNNIFIFQIEGTLDTTANTTILLTDGAQACNIYWVVKGATTLAANTDFKGNLLSQSAAVTVGINTTINGRILSQNAVTFTNPGPSIITVPTCVQVISTPTATPTTATATPTIVTPTATATPTAATATPTAVTATAVAPTPTATTVAPTVTPTSIVVATAVAPTATPTPTVSPTPTAVVVDTTPVAPTSTPETMPVPTNPTGAPVDGKLIGESESLKIWLLPNGDVVIDANLPDNTKETGLWSFDLGGVIYTIEGNESISYTVHNAPVGTYNVTVKFTSLSGQVSALEAVPVTVPTITGGELPTTATPWYNLLLVGSVLTIMGVVMWRRKLHE